MQIPQGLGLVVAMLALGYLLLLAELFVPGGIVGIFGLGAVLYGCYLAFGLGDLWGSAAIVLSVVVTVLGLRAFFRSRMGKRLMLNDPGPSAWKAQEAGLEILTGQVGVTSSDLRPAGIADFEGRRVDVVTDSEFLDSGQRVRVVEVEGNRVVVEAAPEGASVA